MEGIWPPPNTSIAPWAPRVHNPKRRLDRFSHFCKAHACDQQTVGRPRHICNKRPHFTPLRLRSVRTAMRPFVKLLWSLSCNLRLSVCWIFQSLCVSCVDFSPAVFERGEFVNICCISSCRPIGHNVHLNKLSRHNWTTLYKMAQKWRKATELKCLHGGVATINASERAYFDNFIYDFPRSLLISLIGKQFWKSSGIIRNVRRILVRVVNTPLPPEAKKIENLSTKWCILKYIWINMWLA